MNEQEFQALLADFFRITGSSHIESLPGMGRCRCFGVDLELHYDGRIDPACLYGYVDLGSVAPGRQQDVFRTLLMRNPSFRAGHSAVLGLDAESGHLLLTTRVLARPAPSAQALADLVQHWVRKVFVLYAAPPAVRMRASLPRTLRRPS